MKLLLCSLVLLVSACGSEPPHTFIVPQQNNPILIPQQNLIYIKRGYFAGCSAKVVGVSVHPTLGKIFTISPIFCGPYVYNYGWVQERALF